MSSAKRLHELLAGGREINIVCHNNPDPDCLASALALGRIASDAGIDDRRILYSGGITHQQNRAFVNLLDIELEPFEAATVRDRPPDSLLAFVDHSTPGENNQVPEGTAVDVVIDHHPAESIDAAFVDHRVDIGAAATILTEYLRVLELDLGAALATALLFAIRRETLDFLRGVTRQEYEAAGYLHGYADQRLLVRLTTPSVSGATVDTIATAIHNRVTRGATLVSPVGRTRERDALPQAADYLATLEGVETAVVFGVVDGSVHLSARSQNARVHVGNTLKEAFGEVGSAGGHHDAGGGEIPLGIFGEYTDAEWGLLDIVGQVVTARLFEALDTSGGGRA
jgi:nanoRNase/pAp phosphatase (c-di-AMP/oligoRNAs hydrolase)